MVKEVKKGKNVGVLKWTSVKWRKDLEGVTDKRERDGRFGR